MRKRLSRYSFIISSLCLIILTSVPVNTPAGLRRRNRGPQRSAYIGYIIDNKFAKKNKNHIRNKLKNYTKKMALAPDAAKSGYSLFTALGHVIKFDEASNKKIKKFLKKKTSSLKVSFSAIRDKKKLTSIKKLINKD